MSEELTRAEYQAVLRQDFTTFVARLLPRTQSAGRAGDELAPGSHRRQADRGAARQDPAADYQPATASSEIPDGLDRLSGLVSRARRRRFCASAMPRISPTSSPVTAAAS